MTAMDEDMVVFNKLLSDKFGPDEQSTRKPDLQFNKSSKPSSQNLQSTQANDLNSSDGAQRMSNPVRDDRNMMLKNSLMIQKIENKKPTKRLTFKDGPERKRNSSSDARTRPRDFKNV